MEERKSNQGRQEQNNGDMGTSENSNDLQNPINTASKAENEDNDAAVAMTRNPTDRSAGISTKTNITGSDYDGQVST